VGCGDGVYGPLLRRYARELVGLDGSAAGVARARATGAYDAVLQADLGAAAPLPLAADFDVVFSTEVLEHVDAYETMLRHCRAALRPGGLLLLTTTMYYHYPFHALAGRQLQALTPRALADYLLGFACPERRKAYVLRFWDYTGGHYYGFSKPMLLRSFRRTGFRVEEFGWLYAGETIPTNFLTATPNRFRRLGPPVYAASRLLLGTLRAVNGTIERLHLPGPNCLVRCHAE
jgi:2-polyprenyl-3-methyl-5-hydroxy-6-metoxy-1,4-benzoquinol methylase